MSRWPGVLALLLLSGLLLRAAEDMPLVYDREDTAANVPGSPLPVFADLPAIAHLPDPFRKADGVWRARRHSRR